MREAERPLFAHSILKFDLRPITKYTMSYIGNNFAIHYHDKYYKFIAPECYLNKLTEDENGKKKMEDMINPNVRDKVTISTRGFLERVSDIYMTDPTWYTDLSDVPYYILNLAL
jgi:hypothetical protein